MSAETRTPAAPAAGSCISAEEQVRCHLGYEPDDKDFHDMRLLRDRLGITLSESYTSHLDRQET